MLSQIIVSVTSGIFSVVSLVCFLAIYILSHCIFLLHHSRFMARHAHALQSKCQPLHKETMLSTALGFSIGNRVTDHCSILIPEAVGFSQELLPPPVQRKSLRNAEISCISTVQTVQIEIYLRKENYNFISTQHVTREHGSASRKLPFSFTYPVVEENK